jgi:hypothetical protein
MDVIDAATRSATDRFLDRAQKRFTLVQAVLFGSRARGTTFRQATQTLRSSSKARARQALAEAELFVSEVEAWLGKAFEP